MELTLARQSQSATQAAVPRDGQFPHTCDLHTFIPTSSQHLSQSRWNMQNRGRDRIHRVRRGDKHPMAPSLTGGICLRRHCTPTADLSPRQKTCSRKKG
jgi:hypothetical protein